jgi:hypothetical protein
VFCCPHVIDPRQTFDTIKSESPSCRREAAVQTGVEDRVEEPASARIEMPPIFLENDLIGRLVFIGQLGPRNGANLEDIFTFPEAMATERPREDRL